MYKGEELLIIGTEEEIAKELGIKQLEKEISLLPITTHKRKLFRIGSGKLERSYNDLLVVKTCTYNNEVIELDKEDIDFIINKRKTKLNNLIEELKKM